MIDATRIPTALRQRPQWVLWKVARRAAGEKPTKLPFQVDGGMAKAGDPSTWTTFEAIWTHYRKDQHDGIGYEFDKSDPFFGLDLDGCRNAETGKVADWAREIILQMDTYAEVSPSESGVKLFGIGKLPWDSGKNLKVDAEPVCVKAPGIELYDWGRYFAVTGMRLAGPHEPQERQPQLDALIEKFWPAESDWKYQADFRSNVAVVERARRYIDKMPGAVSGSGGHNDTFKVACVLVLGFDLPKDEALSLLSEYNQRCQPPWGEKELRHKIESAAKQGGERGYLRNASVQRWESIRVPDYHEPREAPAAPLPQATTLKSSAKKYLANLKSGKGKLIETGLPDVDYALGGGIEIGEMIILAARPSHGKSAAALQCVHEWTAQGRKTLVISEEMSALAIGKRTLQFASTTPEEHWQTAAGEVDRHLEEHFSQRAECFVVESCGNAQRAVDVIEAHVAEHGVEMVVVDYAQLLAGTGKSRYEQLTNTSVMLRQCASKNKIVLLCLCQLNREIEKRTKFTPITSDLKDTGQLEQDADVIVFLVWPHRIDSSKPPEEFWFFVAKNRNRAINAPSVKCRFLPSRQMILPEPKFSTSEDWIQQDAQRFGVDFPD